MIRKESAITGFNIALGFAGAALLLYLASRLLGALAAMITPFVIALVLASMLDPVVDRIETRIPNRWIGSKRLWAVAAVFLCVLLLLAGLVAFIVPNLIAQTSRLLAFFAPLTYKVERTRADGRFVIVEREATGNTYTIKSLTNGQNYEFRVIASDSEGKQYVLKPAVAKPHTQIVHKEDGVGHTTGTGRANRKSSTSPTVEPEATGGDEDTASEIPNLPTSTPRPSPTPGIAGLFAPLIPGAKPVASPSPSPTPEETDEMPRDERQAGLKNANNDAQNNEVDTTNYEAVTSESNGDVVASASPPVASAQEVATPTPLASSGPRTVLTPMASVTPLAPLTASPPTPKSLPSATPSVLPARPTLTATPEPTPTVAKPTPVATKATPTPVTSNRKSVDKATDVRIPDPGTVLAVPGDGQVRLLWRPPVTAASGFDRLRSRADQWLLEHRSIGPVKLPPNLASIQAQYSAQLSDVLRQISQRAADIIVGSVSTALTITLSLIIGFYLLADFDRLRIRLFHLIPERARGGVLLTITDVGAVFSNYVRGMSTVAFFYGVVSIGVFFVMGMFFDIGLRSYALLLGVMAGVVYPLPFLGPILTTVVVTAVAMATGATPVQGVWVALTVQVQNAIFDNVVTPRVVGQSVGLHPLVTIFALLLGGQVFGLLGMLLSVPTAATIQRLLIRLYPHLGEPTPMVLQNPEHKERLREGTMSNEMVKPPPPDPPPPVT